MRKLEFDAGKPLGAAHHDGVVIILQAVFVPGVATGGARATVK